MDDGLSDRDRYRLREVVKRVHLAHYPDHLLTDAEADKFIEQHFRGNAGEFLEGFMKSRNLTEYMKRNGLLSRLPSPGPRR